MHLVSFSIVDTAHIDRTAVSSRWVGYRYFERAVDPTTLSVPRILDKTLIQLFSVEKFLLCARFSRMSQPAQYRSDESDDSDAQNGYSDNEGIVFAESKKKNSTEEKPATSQPPKPRSKASKHDAEGGTGSVDGGRLKKRRRTVEVNDLPLHDEEDLDMSGDVQLRFRSRIWNEAMVSHVMHLTGIPSFILIFPTQFHHRTRSWSKPPRSTIATGDSCAPASMRCSRRI